MKITLKPLDQQVILITGASSGIGLVTARAAAAKGAKVMLVARDGEALANAVGEIEDAGGVADHAVADVGDAAAVRAAADQAVARFGRIDTWVNNAGAVIFAKLTDTPLDEHERLFRTNYFGVVNGCTAAVERMRGLGGAIITIGSIGSDLPTPILSAYAASKHAVKAYVEALRMELHADAVPIAITLIKPSGIDTPIAQHAANHGDGEALIPPPLYAPELVADAIRYAATHVRRDITVGGAGRAQVLIGQHFPWLLDLITPAMIPAMFDKSQPKTPEDSLDSPPPEGRERSGTSRARSFSLYTAAQLNPIATAGITAVAVAGVVALLTRNRKG